MSDLRNSLGVPRIYQRHPWSRIIDAMIGSSVANNDLLLRASGLWSRKAPGSNGQFLKVISGVPSWATTTGGDGGVGYVDDAYQAADLVISNATTGATYVDTDLQFSLPVGTHRFEIQLFCFAHQTPDMKFRLHFTGTATDVAYYLTNIIEGSTNYFNGTGAAFEIDNILTTTNRHVCTFRGTCKVTGAGTLSVQTAQNSASATAIIGAYRGANGIIWQIA